MRNAHNSKFKTQNSKLKNMTFSDEIRLGIPDYLPEQKPYDNNINHAPKRKEILTHEERQLALDFGLKLLAMCSRIVVYGERISAGMKGEISQAISLGIPVIYRGGMKDAM